MNLWFRTIAGMLSGMRNKLRAERRFAFNSRPPKPRSVGRRGQVPVRQSRHLSHILLLAQAVGTAGFNDEMRQTPRK